MKLRYIVFLFLLSFSIKAQTDKKEIKYRRSSLHTIILDDGGLVKADIIKAAFVKAPIPEKFNDHTLKVRSFDPKQYALTEAEKAKANTDSKMRGVGRSLMGGLKESVAGSTGGLVDTANVRYMPQTIEKYLTANHVARDMVAKWFNRDSTGAFNMNLIGERGSYNASEMQVNIAKNSARGIASIADAGVELIGNTFVVVCRFNYVSKKAIYEASQAAIRAARASGLLGKDTLVVTPEMQKAREEAMKGYVVQTTSYLYQLVWNDSIEAEFYQNLWMDNSSINPKRKEAFDNTNLFSLKYVGDEKAMANVLRIQSKFTEDELVASAAINATDAVIAKLEKSYEVFRTKTPLFSVDPLTAKIGIKEGLEGGDKFEVLEQTIDPKTGRTKYVRVGKIKVDRSQIWDNRFMAGELQQEEAAADPSAPPKPKVDRTLFKGDGKYYPGMLIRQLNSFF